jgi:hypothetical protein
MRQSAESSALGKCSVPMTYGSAELSAPKRAIVGAETGASQLQKRAQNSNFWPTGNYLARK